MKVTRDVVYDLLPTYFSGDASDDTRVLLDEFFASDPEFGRMAERFRTLMTERSQQGTAEIEADREKRVFDTVRARVKLRQAALIWSLGSAFAFTIALVTGVTIRLRHPGFIVGGTFAVAALVMWLLSFARHPEYWYDVFTGNTQDRPSA